MNGRMKPQPVEESSTSAPVAESAPPEQLPAGLRELAPAPVEPGISFEDFAAAAGLKLSDRAVMRSLGVEERKSTRPAAEWKTLLSKLKAQPTRPGV